MLDKNRSLEKEKINAWKLTWYTHTTTRDKAPASQLLVNLAEKAIASLINSGIQALLLEWIERDWRFEKDKKTHSPLLLGQAIAKIIIKHHLDSQTSIFVSTAVERISYIISCIIAETIVWSISGQSFYVLEGMILHLRENDTPYAKKINCLIEEDIVIDKGRLMRIEGESSQAQLESALAALEQLYHAKKAELIRIQTILPKTIVEQLFSFKCKNLLGENFYPLYKTDYKIMLAHAWELKEIYKDSHYVFIHGQKLEHWIYLKFAKILLKKFFPEKSLSLFNLLKLRSSVVSKNSATDLIKQKIDERTDDIRSQVLSVDAYFFNNYGGESASDFCQKNNNVWRGSLKPFLELFIQDNLQLHPTQYNDIIDQIALLAHEISQLSDTGNLVVIGIPKDKTSERIYESHPFGEPCNHNDPKDNLNEVSNVHKKRLDDLQNDVYEQDSNVNCEWTRRNYGKLCVVQYRILANNLDPQEGDRVFILSPLSQFSRNSFKEKLYLLADQLKNIAHSPGIAAANHTLSNAYKTSSI